MSAISKADTLLIASQINITRGKMADFSIAHEDRLKQTAAKAIVIDLLDRYWANKFPHLHRAISEYRLANVDFVSKQIAEAYLNFDFKRMESELSVMTRKLDVMERLMLRGASPRFIIEQTAVSRSDYERIRESLGIKSHEVTKRVSPEDEEYLKKRFIEEVKRFSGVDYQFSEAAISLSKLTGFRINRLESTILKASVR